MNISNEQLCSHRRRRTGMFDLRPQDTIYTGEIELAKSLRLVVDGKIGNLPEATLYAAGRTPHRNSVQFHRWKRSQ